MKRINRTLLDCSPEEILKIGKELIDYYLSKTNYYPIKPWSEPADIKPVKLGDAPVYPDQPPKIWYSTNTDSRDKYGTDIKAFDNAVHCNNTVDIDTIEVDLKGKNNA